MQNQKGIHTFLLKYTGQKCRDEKWKEETIANTSQEQFNREFECEFLGSVNTLIHPTKIKSMVFDDPIQRNVGLDLYKNPVEGRTYALVADVAKGY